MSIRLRQKARYPVGIFLMEYSVLPDCDEMINFFISFLEVIRVVGMDLKSLHDLLFWQLKFKYDETFQRLASTSPVQSHFCSHFKRFIFQTNDSQCDSIQIRIDIHVIQIGFVYFSTSLYRTPGPTKPQTTLGMKIHCIFCRSLQRNITFAAYASLSCVLFPPIHRFAPVSQNKPVHCLLIDRRCH